MYRRIFAWILIVTFLLLIANIIFIGYQRALSALIYIVIVVFFLLTNKKTGED